MCTGIKTDYEEGSIIGRTMDYEVPVDYNILYFPRDYNYCHDLMGRPLYTKYKVLGICFNNRNPLKDGINEHGLAGITNSFAGFNLYSNKVDPDKENVSSLNFFNYALSNYKSVDEIIEELPNIHLASKDHMGEDVISPSFHYMFTDPSKRSIVIEPKRRKLVYHENPYEVLTNSPGFESHIRRLEKYYDLDNLDDFNSSKDLPGGYDPFSRFIKAFFLIHRNKKSQTANQALSHFYNIMASMTMPEGFVRNKKYNEVTCTRYICGYDTGSRLLTIKSHLNPKAYSIGFEDIEDQDRKQSFFVKESFEMEKVIN